MMMYMLAAVTMVLCVTVAQSRWEDGKTYLYSYEAASTVGGTAALDSANVGKISVRLLKKLHLQLLLFLGTVPIY